MGHFPCSNSTVTFLPVKRKPFYIAIRNKKNPLNCAGLIDVIAFKEFLTFDVSHRGLRCLY